MKTLSFERNVPRFAAARIASVLGSGKGAGIGPLRLIESEAPSLPTPQWQEIKPILSGICGSDLATLDAKSSRYFEDLVSFPFVPGHEVVGCLGDGTRVVIEPVLGCIPRRIDPLCPSCGKGRNGECSNVGFGHLAPGLQTGYCKDTGGGWSEAGLVAHPSQIHRVPDALSDQDAVTVEPMACGIHAYLAAKIKDGEHVAIIGAGTLGLSVIAAMTHLAESEKVPRAGRLQVGARYAHQRRFAAEFGADDVLEATQLVRSVRKQAKSLAYGDGKGGAMRSVGGADVVFDCVGSHDSLQSALSMVRFSGRIILVGMPGPMRIDLASLWHKEISLIGTYAYGTEILPKQKAPIRTFDLAFSLAQRFSTGRLVTASYPLDRFEEAIAHAGAAGRRGAVKIAFAPSTSKKIEYPAKAKSGRANKERQH